MCVYIYVYTYIYVYMCIYILGKVEPDPDAGDRPGTPDPGIPSQDPIPCLLMSEAPL